MSFFCIFRGRRLQNWLIGRVLGEPARFARRRAIRYITRPLRGRVVSLLSLSLRLF
jgi:hypothetical protein